MKKSSGGKKIAGKVGLPTGNGTAKLKEPSGSKVSAKSYPSKKK